MRVMTRHRKGSFEVRGGKVCAGVDPTLVVLETASGQWEVCRTAELEDGWYAFDPADAVTRAVKSPDLPNVPPPHQRKALHRARSPSLRGKRCVLTLYGTP
jgi:hypothetical protein